MLLFPKPKKKPKKPWKPITRSKKRITDRATFKWWGKNPFKSYRRVRSDAEVLRMAEIARQKRLADRTTAELAMEAILHSLGIKYRLEHIVLNGDRFVLCDFWLSKWNLVLEIDGSQHRNQKQYDHQRSVFLAEQGYKVVRFWNRECLDGTATARLMQILGVGSKVQ